jgi:hypothetical protein
MIGIKDIDFKIMSELSDRELLSYCLTSKMNNKLCKDETFWMNRTIEKFKIYEKDKNYNWRDFYITFVMYKDSPGKGIDKLMSEKSYESRYGYEIDEINDVLIEYLKGLVKQNLYNGFVGEIRYQLTEERAYRGYNRYNEDQIEKFINDHKDAIDNAIDNTYNIFLSRRRLSDLDQSSIYWARQYLNKYIDWSEYFINQ